MRHFKRVSIITFLLLGGCQMQESVHIKEGVANVNGVKLGWTHCYLLKCTGGYLLIDTDYPKYYARFEKKLANLGVKTSDIKYLLLTHHHDDHAGFAF